MKMGRPHVVPLARQNRINLGRIVDAERDHNIRLPSVAKPGRHMSNNTILKALEASWIQGRMMDTDFAHLHDKRSRRISDIRTKLSIANLRTRHIVALPPLTNRSHFSDQRRDMMQSWANYIDAVGTSNVGGQFFA